MDKRTWARRQDEMRRWNSGDRQMRFERTKGFCSLDAPEGKTLILENAILYDPAERLQRERATEPNQHRLSAPL